MKLTDTNLKGWIAFFLRNKAELLALTDYFNAGDVEKGLLLIPDYLINEGIKSKILSQEKIAPYLEDYSVFFNNGYISLDLSLHLKQLGPVSAKYMISLKDFKFSEGYTRIYASFKEEISSSGNMMQSMALKALLTNSTCLQKAIQLTHCDFAFVDGHNLMIDLGKFDTVSKIAEMFELSYLDCKDGQLKFSFHYYG